MALIRSLNTAVAGLKAQQFRIETIGNNIANVDTTAFKSTRVDFSTLLSQTLSYGIAPEGNLGGIDPVQVGLGTQVASTSTDFNQGPTEATGVNSDLAIQGDGFFILNDSSGGDVYTRDGSFSINPANLLHDPATGYVVQGWTADENFQVSPGGPLEPLELEIGVQTIARATESTTFGGNLSPDGDHGSQGSLYLSDTYYDSRFANDDLISSSNPLGLARATVDTPLANVMRSLGDFVSFTEDNVGTAATAVSLFPELESQRTGVEIEVSALKGERELPSRTFVVGDPPPTGGTTLGDFMGFVQSTLGINTGEWNGVEQAEHTLSYVRTDPVTGEEVNGTISDGNIVSLSSITDQETNFVGVEAGDYVRFTGGAASGQIAEIVGVSASVPGGELDTLTLRTDGFNSLSILPANGDAYVVHAAAGVSIADDVTLTTIDSSPTVTVGAEATNGGVTQFMVSDTSIPSLVVDEGVRPGLLVEYQSGGVTVTGRVLAVNGNEMTIAYPSTAGQAPDAGTSFSVIDQADGTMEVAGNVGVDNDLSILDVVSDGSRIPMFDNPPVVEAEGQSANMSITVYDSLGTPRPVNLTFVFEGSSANGPNTWRYFAESPDDTNQDRVVGSGTIVFNASGQFVTTGKKDELVTIDLDSTPDLGGGTVTPFSFNLDFSRMTQFATSLSEVQLREQDGFEAGVLRDFAVGENGVVTGIFDNGLTRSLGQIPVVRFANPNGLQEETGNFYSASTNSGVPQVGVAGTFGRGSLRSGVLEESNVDLASQFTDLIIGQRAFQANARTITVSDEMLQELVNLI